MVIYLSPDIRGILKDFIWQQHSMSINYDIILKKAELTI
jgi:uncharacterized protein Usg